MFLNSGSLFIDKVNSFSVFDSDVLSSFVDFSDVLGEDSFFRVMHFSELALVDFGSLDDFDLSDLDVLDWINVGDFLGDLFLNNFRGEKLEDVSGVGLGDLFSNDFVHFSSD